MGIVKFFKALLGKIAAFFIRPTKAATPQLITPQNNPELVQEVKAKMEAFDLSTFTARFTELEKAVYQLSYRQKQLGEQIEQLESALIAMSTTLEELLNSIHVVADGQEGMDAQDDEETDDEDVNDAWETKKGTSSLN